ncbi:hypothetical protein EJB05_45508, partial [Eragrostis curvula]
MIKSRSGAQWIPPPPGKMKLNVDAAMAKNLNKSAAAAIARGEAGNFVGASVLVMEGVTDWRLWKQWPAERPLLWQVILCQVVQEINSQARDFSWTEFVHEGRTSNFDAHCFARSSVSLELGRHVYLLDPPVGVCNSIPSDA